MDVIENPEVPLDNSPKPAEAIEPLEDNSSAPKTDPVSPKSDRNSPDPNCAICLSRLENKSFTDSCFHQFCFTCLLEWSKVKAECPLCKQAFKSIIHNVRSIEDYDQYHLRAEENAARETQERRFRYRTTATRERLVLGQLLQQMVVHSDNLRNFRMRVPRRPKYTSEFRRQIYNQGTWIQPIDRSGVNRFRNITPSFFRENPACTHRLVPWLNRELVALLTGNEDRITFVLELILSLIQRYDILSPEFSEHVRPFILSRTDHFMHEFYNFARAPWDMRVYDQQAVYQNTIGEISSGSDSDVIIISPERHPATNTAPNTISAPNSMSQNSSVPTPPVAQTFLSRPTNEAPFALERVKQFLNCMSRSGWNSNSILPSNWDRPSCEPPPFPDHPSTIPLPPSPQPGPSGLDYGNTTTNISDNDSCSSGSTAVASTSSWNKTLSSVVSVVKNEKRPVDNDDDCVIVGYQKPFKDRTPPLIDLVSDSEDSAAGESKKARQESRVIYKQERHSRSRSRSRSPTRSRSTSKSKYNSAHKSSTSHHSSSERVYCRRSSFHSKSPPQWHWTASDGGGKLQRSYSDSKEHILQSAGRLRSLVVVDPNNSSLEHSKRKSKHKHKKHKKHKHKHRSSKDETEHKFKKHDRGHKNRKSLNDS